MPAESATPAETAKDAECIFLCVGDGGMAEDRILGSDGVAKGAKKGPTYGPRSATDIALVAKTISDNLQAAALVLNEVNGVSGKKQ